MCVRPCAPLPAALLLQLGLAPMLLRCHTRLQIHDAEHSDNAGSESRVELLRAVLARLRFQRLYYEVPPPVKLIIGIADGMSSV